VNDRALKSMLLYQEDMGVYFGAIKAGDSFTASLSLDMAFEYLRRAIIYTMRDIKLKHC